MSYVVDFSFNGNTRIGDDLCSQDMNSIQNVRAANYTLQNYAMADCTMKTARDFATMQPGIMLNGFMGSDLCGGNIDESSRLIIGGVQTNPRSKLDLMTRPFLTVPFLGRGTVNPVLETQILHGESSSNRKTITRVPDKNMIGRQYTPLLPSIKSQIQDPKYLVESMAHPNWVRGGIPSRDLMRDTHP